MQANLMYTILQGCAASMLVHPNFDSDSLFGLLWFCSQIQGTCTQIAPQQGFASQSARPAYRFVLVQVIKESTRTTPEISGLASDVFYQESAYSEHSLLVYASNCYLHAEDVGYHEYLSSIEQYLM